jgi:hypothetical protein
MAGHVAPAYSEVVRGGGELMNDWAMEEDLDSEDILMGDQ